MSSPLIDAARAGEPWAWQELYDRLAGPVSGYLRMQGALEPEDLTSEVFIGVFKGIDRFVGDEQQFRSWVFVIAHRRVQDERRRRKVRPPVAEAESDDPALPGDEAEELALERIGHERVVALCERLVPDQRDVLFLRIVGDLTLEQVAEALGKSTGAVKALQRRGLAALRRLLEGEGVPL